MSSGVNFATSSELNVSSCSLKSSRDVTASCRRDTRGTKKKRKKKRQEVKETRKGWKNIIFHASTQKPACSDVTSNSESMQNRINQHKKVLTQSDAETFELFLVFTNNKLK